MKRKNLAKSVAFALALATVATPCVSVLQPMTVMAETIVEGNIKKGSVTVVRQNTKKEAVAGAVFKAYQIVKLNPDEAPGVWETYKVDDTYAPILGTGFTPDDLGNYSAADMEAIIEQLEVATRTDSTPYTSTTSDANGNAVFSNMDLGWYLIVEETTPAGNIATSPFLVAVPSTDNIIDPNGTPVAGNNWIYDITATPKATAITVDKNITNGQAAEDSSWVEDGEEYKGKEDTVAYGDYVKYTVESVVPAYGDSYFHENAKHAFIFKDIMSDGLTIQNSGEHLVKVYALGADDSRTEIPANGNFVITATENTGNENPDLTVDFSQAFLQNDEYRGKNIEIEYYALVNEHAVMGSAGNTNDVYMTYSSQPTVDTTISPVEGEDGEKEPDTYVYTFGIAVDKFGEADENGNQPQLADAQFKLFKDVDLTEEVTNGVDGGEAVLTTDENGALTFERLDAGIYYLKEVKSPSGYALLTNPIKVEIRPTLNDDTNQIDDGEFTLFINDVQVTATSGNNVTVLDTDAGIATVAVENHEGFTLPVTGGTGIAVTVSIALAGLACLSFIMVKSKKKAEQQ